MTKLIIRMPTSLSFYRYEKQLNASHSENAFKSLRNIARMHLNHFQQENKNLFYFH